MQATENGKQKGSSRGNYDRAKAVRDCFTVGGRKAFPIDLPIGEQSEKPRWQWHTCALDTQESLSLVQNIPGS
jgi:hypothetical protein